MSDPLGDHPSAQIEDDTSVGAVTQGGHGTRRGNSWWWIAVLLVIALALALAWLSTRHGDIVGKGVRTAMGQATLRLASPA